MGAAASQLLDSADKGELQKVRLLVQRHPDCINAVYEQDGRTALHIAAGRGFDVIVRELLDRGASPAAVDKAGRTPLHLAAGGGHVEAAKALVRKGCPLLERDADGRTALDYARTNNKAAVLALLQGALAMSTSARGAQMATVAALSTQPASPTYTTIPETAPPPPPPQEQQLAAAAQAAFAPPPPPPPPAQPQAPSQRPNPLQQLAAAVLGFGKPQQQPPHPTPASNPSSPTKQSTPPAATPYEPPLSTQFDLTPYQAPPTASSPTASDSIHYPWEAIAPSAPPVPPSEQQLLLDPLNMYTLNLPTQPSQPPAAMQPQRSSVDDWYNQLPAAPRNPLPQQQQPPPPPQQQSSASSRPSGTAALPPDAAAGDDDDDDDWGAAKDSGDWGQRPHKSSASAAATGSQRTTGQPPRPARQQQPQGGQGPGSGRNPNLAERMARMMLDGLGHLYKQHHQQLGLPLLPPLLSGPVPNINAQQPAAAAAPAGMDAPAAAAVQGASSGRQPGSPSADDLGVGRRYSYQQLAVATDNFARHNFLGQGGYGAVYKGIIDGTPVALKVMDTSPGSQQGLKEFTAEVRILSRLHHPHILLLLGACPDRGILVYELMEGGSLEERLLQGLRAPLAWSERVRVVAEVASALAFLHSSPEPIIHMDLKPGNILLSRSLVAKVGDVGLARLAPQLSLQASTVQDSEVVGTLAYMDPEYLRSGCYGPKSDVYSLGMVMMQVLTGADVTGVVERVQRALDSSRTNPSSITAILDPKAGSWPVSEATAFAHLALRCVEFQRTKRPDLRQELLPQLLQLQARSKLFASQQAAAAGQSTPVNTSSGRQEAEPPAHYVCPITQEVMVEPVFAADGYTYERMAIEAWVQGHSTSPMTNLPLQHSQLTPNLGLRSAIREWLDNNRVEG